MDKYGFVMASEYRKEVVRKLDKSPTIPVNLSRLTGIHLSHISNTLEELKNENIVVCINPKRKKGRVYRLTNIGNWIAKRLI